MQIKELDAARWSTVADFYEAILQAIGAPDWHGNSVNALVDTMIWGDFNKLKPPYKISVKSTGNLPKDVKQEIDWAEEDLTKARENFNATRGRDIEVVFEVVR